MQAYSRECQKKKRNERRGINWTCALVYSGDDGGTVQHFIGVNIIYFSHENIYIYIYAADVYSLGRQTMTATKCFSSAAAAFSQYMAPYSPSAQEETFWKMRNQWDFEEQDETRRKEGLQSLEGVKKEYKQKQEDTHLGPVLLIAADVFIFSFFLSSILFLIHFYYYSSVQILSFPLFFFTFGSSPMQTSSLANLLFLFTFFLSSFKWQWCLLSIGYILHREKIKKNSRINGV